MQGTWQAWIGTGSIVAVLGATHSIAAAAQTEAATLQASASKIYLTSEIKAVQNPGTNAKVGSLPCCQACPKHCSQRLE